MRYIYLISLVGMCVGASQIACSSMSFSDEILSLDPLSEAIKRGDLEEVQFILHSSALHEVLKSNNRQALMLAVTEFLDSLSFASATGNTWWYMEVGAGTVSAAAVMLLGWRWSKKESGKGNQMRGPESDEEAESDLPPQKHPKEDKTGHGQEPTNPQGPESDRKPTNPDPGPIRDIERNSTLTPSNGDHGRHISFSESSESDKGAPPALNSPSEPSNSTSANSSSEEIKEKKKHWWQFKKKNRKDKKKKSSPSSSDDDEKIRATANTGLFSSIYAKLKGTKNKQLLETEAETRMAIVQELLNEPDCDPAMPDASGISPLSLIRQKLNEFSSTTWQGELLNKLYQLIQARS